MLELLMVYSVQFIKLRGAKKSEICTALKVRFHYRILATNWLSKSAHKQISLIFVLFVSGFAANEIGVQQTSD
jgi:hypothetical protein